REENGALADEEAMLLRMLTPIVKLTTAKQAVACASEILESFGGAGYVEDTGLPRLLRDAQVLPIWEGTTNVLSLDVMRVLKAAGGGALGASEREVATRARRANPELADAARAATDAVAHAKAWLARAMESGLPAVEAGARRFALTLGRALELALLVDHA